jgi:hypothetical protein
MQRREFLWKGSLAIASLPALTRTALRSVPAFADVPALTLIGNNQAKAIIAIPPDSNEIEKLAAADLAMYIEKMSGAKLETANVEAKDVESFRKSTVATGKIPIFIGRNVLPLLQKELGENSKTRGAFVLKADKDSIEIAGNDEGTYYGVLELLEQQGVRWFMPGDLGEVVPQLKTIEVKEQSMVQSPSFPSRWFQMPGKDWQMRVRCGGDVFGGGHGIPAPPYRLNKTTGEYEPKENAEYYSLVKGKRVPRQHCVSNPKLIEYVANDIIARRTKGAGPVIALGPNDGGGFCECENCRALDAGDYDAFSGEPSVTDRYIWFFNQVLAKVLPQYPDTKTAFYIYHTYMRPPLREKPNPHITGALAPIALDRVHGFSNPIAPEKSYALWLLQEWGKLLPEIYDRSYWSNLSDPGFSFVIVSRLRDEIPVSKQLGLKGFRVETFPNYGPQFPSMYIAGKLMWNSNADVDVLLQDCYDMFFGPASKPMGQYITMMDAALRDGDYNTGSAWNIPDFYPAELRAKARVLLGEGARLAAGKGIYEQRVQMITQTFDLTDAFCKMMDARAKVDFAAAQSELTKMDAVADILMNYKPVAMLSAGRFSTYVNYMRRFFRGATEQGYARVTGGNKLVAAAPDEWDFQIDPMQVGEDIGFWKTGITGGNWQKLKTSSASWSDQGLRYYKGLAWYRTEVNVPREFAGQRIFLWCGGVDETAKVWVNGQVIAISPGAAFYPFEMDTTDSVKPGRNIITMCVSNQIVNEIGTGGIVAPVILYAPAKGKEATLENARDLKPTFP